MHKCSSSYYDIHMRALPILLEKTIQLKFQPQSLCIARAAVLNACSSTNYNILTYLPTAGIVWHLHCLDINDDEKWNVW